MGPRFASAALAAAAALLILLAAAEDYCYDEPHCDPYAWGETFPSCHPLLDQFHSPIDLSTGLTRNLSLGPLLLEGFQEAPPGLWSLRNDGHSVLLQVGGGLTVSGGGLPDVYHTVQLHFHWGTAATNGSEHTLDGRRFPMEMHVVSMKSIHPNMSAALDDPTGLAVLGFFIDVVYAENVPFALISQKLSSVAHKGQSSRIEPFPLLDLLPKKNLSQYYRYHGSITTPPCSRAVVWTVYEAPVLISWSQLEQFTSRIFSTEESAERPAPLRNNFRHVHPAFGRSVEASRDARLLPAAGRPLRSTMSTLLLLTWLRSFNPGP